MTIQIKHPPFIDISHWIEVPDFALLEPRPWLVGTKATEGTAFLDAKYGLYSEEIRKIGARLLSYHFMNLSDPTKQANWFSEIVIQGGLRQNELLACDMEMRGIPLSSVKTFLDRTQVLTGIRPIIYSTEMLIEDLYIGGVPPAWLKNEWLWIAEYPGNPDLTNDIPSWIIPYGLTVNNIAAWQYTDDGVYPGIPGNNVDLNLINPIYIQAIGLTEPIPAQGEPPMEEVLYFADLKAGYVSNVRNAPGISAGVINQLTGPVTVSITREAVVQDGYNWYYITAPKTGFIALTSSYERFRVNTTEDLDRPVKITVETASGKIFVATEFSEEV